MGHPPPMCWRASSTDQIRCPRPRSRAPAADCSTVLSRASHFASVVPPSTIPAASAPCPGSAHFSKVLSTCFFASATLSSKYTCRKMHML